jgi:YD repeat-containing protein
MTASGSSAVTYTYNNADELTDIDQEPGHVDYTYDPLGRLAQVIRPSVTQAYTYDSASQLTSITYSNATGTLGDLQYTHDTNGNLTNVTGSWARTSLPPAQSGLTYNAVNRLTARKFTAAQAAYDGLTGCATGATLTMGIGGIYRAYQSIRFTAEVVETQATIAARSVPEGIVYRRTDLLGGRPYVGQAKNEARYWAPVRACASAPRR